MGLLVPSRIELVANMVPWSSSKFMFYFTPLFNRSLGSLKCASCSNWKVYIPKSYSFWVPLEVYIKRKSKIQCFGPVLSSWRFSIHLLELKIQLLWIPPCHTSKVVSWLVDCCYEPYLWSFLSKNLLKVSKTGENSCVLHFCQILTVFETLSKFLLR